MYNKLMAALAIFATSKTTQTKKKLIVVTSDGFINLRTQYKFSFDCNIYLIDC